jgi:hypothetical protein
VETVPALLTVNERKAASKFGECFRLLSQILAIELRDATALFSTLCKFKRVSATSQLPAFSTDQQ